MKYQKGFTLTELLIVLWFLFCAALSIGAIWVLVHFISKFW